jgi:hypothetical protein
MIKLKLVRDSEVKAIQGQLQEVAYSSATMMFSYETANAGTTRARDKMHLRQREGVSGAGCWASPRAIYPSLL